MKAFFQISAGEDHNRFAEGEGLVGNCGHLVVELGLWDGDLFGSLALGLGNLDGGFDMFGFVFDMRGMALDSLAVH